MTTMRRLATAALFCLLLICSLVGPTRACTSFCLDTPDGLIFATNLDLYIGEGLVFVNGRGISKEGWKQSTSSVQEAIQVDSLMQPEDKSPSHFLVADETEECATLEYLDSRFVCHTGERLPVKALANAPYADGVAFIEQGIIPAFNFRAVDSPCVKHLSLRSYDLSCDAPLLMLDVNAELEGNVERSFMLYDHRINLDVFRNFCDRWGIEVTKEDAVELMRFFESFECAH
jgi:hypothetical protein